MAWDAGAAPADESAPADLSVKPGGSPATRARLRARSTIVLLAAREVAIQPRAETARDERHQIENVTDD